MSKIKRLLRQREKLFGYGRPRPLDRNAKVRIMTLARALTRRTEKGKAYGCVKAKALAVLEALLWGFHNARGGLCFPSYEKIAERAACARSTVAEAIKALEDCGLLSWVNRLVRVRKPYLDVFGRPSSRVRVIRTSNAYEFHDPKAVEKRGTPSKSDFPTGTTNQDSSFVLAEAAKPQIDPTTELGAALLRFKAAIEARKARPS